MKTENWSVKNVFLGGVYYSCAEESRAGVYHLQSTPLVNSYLPNDVSPGRQSMLNSIGELLVSLDAGTPIVWAGDLKSVQNPLLERHESRTSSNTCSQISWMICDRKMHIDFWSWNDYIRSSSNQYITPRFAFPSILIATHRRGTPFPDFLRYLVNELEPSRTNPWNPGGSLPPGDFIDVIVQYCSVLLDVVDEERVHVSSELFRSIPSVLTVTLQFAIHKDLCQGKMIPDIYNQIVSTVPFDIKTWALFVDLKKSESWFVLSNCIL